jgi:hypothetical protein
MKLKCKGKAHPDAGRRAVEDCPATIEVEQITPKSTYLCRDCAPGDSKNGNTRFQNWQFDKKGLKGSAGKKVAAE